MIRVAILDLYEGQPNEGMRCIRQILTDWSEFHNIELHFDEFEVRRFRQVPDMSYDIFISSGGPGSPLDSEGTDWEEVYFGWFNDLQKWNNDSANPNKKHVFYICHSFQLVCRHLGIGFISKRKSTAFGVFPVHVTVDGQNDVALAGLRDPFYVVDSRDYQVTAPDVDEIERAGAKVLCIEKYRPHVPYPQALMSLRFDDYSIGTQFHPEADAIGMSMYLQKEEKKKIVIEHHGIDKWTSMVEQLNDPDKIMWTYSHVLPNFLRNAVDQLKQQHVMV